MDNTVSVLYPYLIQFVVTLCTVAFKGFQTKNIMGNHYKRWAGVKPMPVITFSADEKGMQWLPNIKWKHLYE